MRHTPPTRTVGGDRSLQGQSARHTSRISGGDGVGDDHDRPAAHDAPNPRDTIDRPGPAGEPNGSDRPSTASPSPAGGLPGATGGPGPAPGRHIPGADDRAGGPTPHRPDPTGAPGVPDGQSTIEALPHGLAVVDARGVVVATNRRWAPAGTDALTGAALPSGPTVSGAVGTDLLAALRAATGSQAAVAEHVADGLDRLLDGRGRSFQIQYQVAVPDEPADPCWYLLAAERLPQGGLVITRTETTVHHSVNDMLADLAFHDTLTGLPNRGLVLDRMRMALIRAQRLRLLPLVVFVDLDGFKAINDQHGHAAGDAVLVEVARRLTAAVRESDTCGRWGGDEFVLIVELTTAAAAPRVLERLRQAFTGPVVLADGTPCPVTPSIGAVVADGSERVEALIRHADAAMYRAKRSQESTVLVAADPPAADGPTGG